MSQKKPNLYFVAATTYTVYHAIKGVDDKGKVFEDAFPKASGIDHATGEDIQRDFAQQQITGRLIFIPEDRTL